MSTSQDELDKMLADVPAAKPAGLRLEPRRRPAAAPKQRDELDDLLEEAPAVPVAAAAKPAHRAPVVSAAPASAGVDPRLDAFVNDVIGEASRRSGYTYKLGEGVRTPAQQAGKVAQGVSWTLNSRHLSGHGRDVLAFDERGNYIKDGSHPAYTTLGEVYGERSASAPAPVKWGVVRDGRQVDPGHFELGETDALDDVLSGVPAAEGQGDELDQLLSGVPTVAGDDEEVERVNSIPASVSAAPPLSKLPPSKGLDPYSSDSRARRDAAASSRVRAVTVPLSRSLADYEDSSSLMADAYREGARSLSIPSAFVEEWIKSHPGDMRLIGDRNAPDATPADLLGSSAHDARRNTVTLNLGGLADLERDYKAQRSLPGRAADFVTDDTTTAGEKFLDVAAPVASAVGRVGDLATRPLSATSTAFWSLARKHSPTEAVDDAWHEFRTGETNPGAGNWLAEKVAQSETLKRINPNLPAMAGGVVEMLTDPANAVPLGVLARGAGFARSLKGVRAVEEALMASRDARALEFFQQGGRILKIEGVADDLAGLRVVLKDSGGATHTIKLTPAQTAAHNDLDQIIDELPDEFAAQSLPPAGAPKTAGERVRRLARDIQDVVNITKAIPASFDNSALMGQGSVIVGARPSLAPGAIGDAARSAMSPSKFADFKKRLVTHPNQDLRESSGLYLGSIMQGEETFGSRFAEKIPGVAASQRAYEATLDSLRSNAFDLYAERLTKAGVTDQKAFKDMARWVNVATGRGEMGRLEPLADVLNLPMFSPRLLASKFNIISPVRYARMHPAARKIALTEMFRASGSLATTMGLAKMAGADVDLDPFSGGFGTIDADGTSYDLSGGRLRALRFAAQIGDSINRERRGEEVKEDRTPAALTAKFFRAYLSPVGQLAVDWKTGQNYDGSEFRGDWRELSRLAPFAAKEMYAAYEKAGVVGAVKAAPTLAGVGVNTKDKQTEPIMPTLSTPVQDELSRLGLDLNHLGAVGKKSASINPRYQTEGITGDSFRPFGGVTGKPGREVSGMGVNAEETARAFSAELDQVLSEEINSPGWESMSDDDRAQRLDLLIVNVHKRAMNKVRVEGRGAEMEKEKKVKERLDRMSNGSRSGQKNFKL